MENFIGRFFPAIILAIVMFLFVIFGYLSLQSFGNNESCKRACGIYVSKIIDDDCYCKTMPQTFIQFKKIELIK